MYTPCAVTHGTSKLFTRKPPPDGSPVSLPAGIFYILCEPLSVGTAVDNLAETGREVAAGIHYPVPVHTQPAYAGRIRHGKLPVTEMAVREILSLPIYPELTEPEVRTVTGAVADYFAL